MSKDNLALGVETQEFGLTEQSAGPLQRQGHMTDGLVKIKNTAA